jgi:hypothetical protein
MRQRFSPDIEKACRQIENQLRAYMGHPPLEPWEGPGATPKARPPTAMPIKAEPYMWTAPESITLRDWLYGRLLVRQFTSMTIAPGGVGKSSLIVAETLAMVSGRDLVGVLPRKRLRVWLWNLEDPQAETTRKIQATAKHYKLKATDIVDNLFVNSGRDLPLVIAKTAREGVTICQPVVDDLVEQIRARGIDVLIIDPFVSCHEVEENDNSAIDQVAKEWSRVADLGNCAVHLVHHTRKAPAGTEVTTESGRGAKALTDACRVARAINQMSEKESKAAGVENHRLYFRTYNDKANLAPPVTNSDWFMLTSVNLGNGPLGTDGDSVGVVTKWELPDPLDGITGRDFDKVASVIRGGSWRDNPQAKAWVGHAIAKALGLDVADKLDKAKVSGLLRVWLGTGSLIKVERVDADSRKEKTFVEVANED